MREVWKDVVGFEDSYAVSNKGRVKSKARWITRRNDTKYFHPERILIPSQDDCGYYHVRLAEACKYKLFKIHRLVAKHFLDDYSEELTVNHIDHNKNNNSIDNLEMLTRSDNIKENSVKQIIICLNTNERVIQIGRYLKDRGIIYNRYRLIQSIRQNKEYMHTGLYFKYAYKKHGEKK